MINNNFLYNGISLEELLLYESKFTEKHHIENISFIKEFLSDKKYISTKTSGSTGDKKKIKITKEHMVNSAFMTGAFFSLNENTKSLLCMPSNYIAGKMMIVRALILGWDLKVISPCINPLEKINEIVDFTALTPMQFINSKKKYFNSKNILIGGGNISLELKNEINKMRKSNFYHSYGMTETVSHIAICNIKKDDYFKVLDGIKIYIDKNNCLIINAPKLSSKEIRTKDIVEIINNKEFKFLGRYDNMVNSGGIKIIPELLEKKLDKKINRPFFFIGKKDETLGEKLILFIEGKETNLDKSIFTGFKKYEIPKKTIFIPKFAYTETEKINRKRTLKLYEQNC